MFEEVLKSITSLSVLPISDERKTLLKPLIAYIQEKLDSHKPIRLNFICTHNSRRSHLAQVWSQTMAFHFGVQNVFCYSGGTEATAMFSKVSETLLNQGFQIMKLGQNENPVYAVKYASNQPPIICFSKIFDANFNPRSEFASIMTCSSADVGCPYIAGAEKRFPICYDDPKAFDGTTEMDVKYFERSYEIASEMYFVFATLKVEAQKLI